MRITVLNWLLTIVGKKKVGTEMPKRSREQNIAKNTISE